MKGGNGESVANEVTLCSNRAYQTDEAEKLLGWRPSLGANLTACRQGNAEASKNLLNVKSRSDLLDRGCVSRPKKTSRGDAEMRRMFAKI